MASSRLNPKYALKSDYAEKILLVGVITPVYVYQLSKLFGWSQYTPLSYLHMLEKKGLMESEKITDNGREKIIYKTIFSGSIIRKQVFEQLDLPYTKTLDDFMKTDGYHIYMHNLLRLSHKDLFGSIQEGLASSSA